MSSVGIVATPAPHIPQSGSTLVDEARSLFETLEKTCVNVHAPEFLDAPSGPDPVTRSAVNASQVLVNACMIDLQALQQIHAQELAHISSLSNVTLTKFLSDRHADPIPTLKADLLAAATALAKADHVKAATPAQQALTASVNMHGIVLKAMEAEVRRLATYDSVCTTVTAAMSQQAKFNFLGTDSLGSGPTDISLHTLRTALSSMTNVSSMTVPILNDRMLKIIKNHGPLDPYSDVSQSFTTLVAAFMKLREEIKLDPLLLVHVSPAIVAEYVLTALPKEVTSYPIRTSIESAPPLASHTVDYSASSMALRMWLSGVTKHLDILASRLPDRDRPPVKAFVAAGGPVPVKPPAPPASFVLRDATAEQLIVMAKKHVHNSAEGPCPIHPRGGPHALYCCLSFTDKYIRTVPKDKADKAFMAKVEANKTRLDELRAQAQSRKESREASAASKIA